MSVFGKKNLMRREEEMQSMEDIIIPTTTLPTLLPSHPTTTTTQKQDSESNPLIKHNNNTDMYSTVLLPSQSTTFKQTFHALKLTCMQTLFKKLSCNKQTCIHILKYFIRLFIFLILFGISSMIGKIVTMVYVVPRVDVNAPPASDLLLDFFKHANPNAFKATEIMTGILTAIMILISFIHSRERCFIIPRFLFISATLINLRTLCISMTSFSIPSKELHHACSQLQSLSEHELLWKSINFFEFSETCGDYVFSGHATGLVVVSWFVWYYGRSIPLQISTLLMNKKESTRGVVVAAFLNSSLMKVVYNLMNLLLICLVLIGCMCILFAKEHYSVDVVVGGVISIMWCSLYHLLIDIYRKKQLASINLYHRISTEEEEMDGDSNSPISEEYKSNTHHMNDLETSAMPQCIYVWFYITEGPWKQEDDSDFENRLLP